MTKQEAIEEFESDVLPSVVEAYGSDDEVAVNEEWNNWTDMLCKEGRITGRQYSTWVYDGPSDATVKGIMRGLLANLRELRQEVRR